MTTNYLYETIHPSMIAMHLMGLRRETPKPTLFKGGTLVVTTGVQHLASTNQALAALLYRHLTGDWGDLCDEDKAENQFSLENDYRILSHYKFTDAEGADARVYIITEWDRSLTTILLPDEY